MATSAFREIAQAAQPVQWLPGREGWEGAPALALRCRACKAAIEADYEEIRDAKVYDIDCTICGRLNTFIDKATVARLDRFRAKCDRYERSGYREDRASGRGSVGARLRWAILCRDGFRCRYCGVTAEAGELHVDHVVSRYDGGGNDLDNLATACATCNLGKGADSVVGLPS